LTLLRDKIDLDTEYTEKTQSPLSFTYAENQQHFVSSVFTLCALCPKKRDIDGPCFLQRWFSSD